MKRVWVCVLAVAWMAALIGCGESGAGKSDTEKEFQKLYKQYSARFYEKLTTEAETMNAVQIMAEAARIWDEVFGPHKTLVAQRVDEILKDLDMAGPIQEDLYLEVASGSRTEPPPDQPRGIVLKQFLWNPIGAAQMGLNNWLVRLLAPQSFSARNVLQANAAMFWEAVDRNPDRPKLLLRQGPMIFIVDVIRKDDYYEIDKIRWLRPKIMGPLVVPSPSGGTTPPVGTTPPATGTMPAATPAPGTPPPVPGSTEPTGTGTAAPALTPPALPPLPPAPAPAAEKAKG
jgi:hypothetical protein